MIEQMARSSAEQLRAGTSGDVAAGLADLHVRRARHLRRTKAGVVAAVVLAVGLGWIGGAALTGRDQRGAEPVRPAPNQSYFRFPCQVNRVECLGNRTYQFDLVRPVRWRLPSDFRISFGLGVAPRLVQGYGPDGRSNVMVLEQVRAASPRGDRPAPGVADDPHAFVDWVAHRPFLRAAPVVLTELDGHQAWQVQATLARGAGPGRRLCGSNPCHLLTFQPDSATTGISLGMTVKLTAFRLPGAGTTVVFTWTSTGDLRDLDHLDKAVDGLSWPEP